MNIWDILILAAVFCAAAGALRILRKKGKGGSCGCAECGKSCCEKRENDRNPS